MKNILLNSLKVLAGLAIISPVYSTQVLSNNEFLSEMSGWQTEGSGFSAVPGSDQYGSHVDINISNGGSDPWDVKLFQSGITLKKGYEYTLEWGASRESGVITVGVGEASAPYTNYISDEISFSGDYLDHTKDNGNEVVYHHCDDNASNLRLYLDLGGNNANARLAWVSLGEELKSCDGGGTTDPGDGGTDPGGSDLDNPGIGPVSYYGQLQATGNRLKGSRTKTDVQVRGMSLFWSTWGGEDYYNSGAVETLIKDWDIELVRAAMAVEVDGGYISSPKQQMTYVKTVIESAIENDIYVIVDFHTHLAHNYQSDAIRFFGEIAKEYGQNDHVIFEIFNEPLQISWSTVKNYATGVINEIRKYSDNLIVVGTPNWSQDVELVLSNKIKDVNVAYALHFYAAEHKSSLRIKANKALNGDVPLMVTEWGTVNANGNGAVDTNSSNEWLAYLDKNKISWANWSLNDKREGASALKFSADDFGSDWATMRTSSGNYVYNKLTGYSATAEWRLAEPSTPNFKTNINALNGIEIKDNLISLPTNGAKTELSIYNLKGTKVFNKTETQSGERYIAQWPIQLKNGMYIVHIQNAGKSYLRKINK